MRRTIGEEIRRLNKHLIPVNLFVCILSVIAAVSLFFMPLFKIDIGKMLEDQQIRTYINEVVDDKFMGGVADIDTGDSTIDVVKMAADSVDAIVSSIKGDITISTNLLAKIAFSDDPGKMLTETLFTGDGALLDTMIDSMTDGIKGAVENVVIDSLTIALVQMGGEVTEGLDQEALGTAFRKIGEAESREEAEVIVADYLDTLDGQVGVELSDEDKETIREKVLESYDRAVEEAANAGTEYNMEAFICVAVSDAMNQKGSSTPDDIEDEIVEQFPVRTKIKTAAEGEADGEQGSGTTSGDKVYLSYEELINGLSGMEMDKGNVSESIKAILNDTLDQYVAKINENRTVLYIVFGVFAFFSAIWVIQFLFAFIRLFPKNKKVAMWYTKLLGWIPCVLFWLVPTVAKSVLPGMFPEFSMLISAALSGLSSMTWISGICYLALWIVSIFWAHPIKKRIKRVKRMRNA